MDKAVSVTTKEATKFGMIFFFNGTYPLSFPVKLRDLTKPKSGAPGPGFSKPD